MITQATHTHKVTLSNKGFNFDGRVSVYEDFTVKSFFFKSTAWYTKTQQFDSMEKALAEYEKICKIMEDCKTIYDSFSFYSSKDALRYSMDLNPKDMSVALHYLQETGFIFMTRGGDIKKVEV